ncbi:MAG: TRAP transporter small permease subunit [Alphaproteobacteria bacterium]
MPSLTFELPHWVYWLGLLVFPLIALYLVRRQQAVRRERAVTLPTGYLLWLCGGFVGLHRFYVKSWRFGFVYIPLFVAILYGNIKGRAALDAVSGARNEQLGIEFDVERFQSAVAEGAEAAAEKLAKAEQALAAVEDQLATATVSVDFWDTFSGAFAAVIAALLLIDAILLPRLMRRCAEREAKRPPTPEPEAEVTARQRRMGEDPSRRIHSRVTDVIDAISGWSGHFVCYWSVIAVFVYYYEVLARYVFNSPTNWAHESMFLMFGMQYLLSGAYAFREGSHVRVDVVYQHLPDRAKVVTDIVTSVFFFIFAGTLLVTGWIFLADAIRVWEVSFTEWGVQYWPVKISIVLGALLILLQGLSKLIKDIFLLTRVEA